MLAQKFGVALPGAERGRRRCAARRGAARSAAQGARDRGGVVPRAAGGAGRRARARQQLDGSRRHAADDRAARARLRAAVARRAEGAAAEAGLRAGAAAAERAGRAARQRRGRRSVPQPADDADLPRHRLGHRVRRPRDGRRSGAEVPELAGDADLLEGPDALRPEPDEERDPEARVRGPGRGLFRLRAGVSDAGGAGGRLLRHGADAAAGAAAAALHDEGRAQLRSRRRRPGRGGAVVRAAGRRRLRRQRRRAGQGRGSRYVHPAARARDGYRERLRSSRPYLEYLLDQAAAGLDFGHDDSRRQFLGKMLAVAARIPDAAARDQFADRIAHKARITEEVVRAEIRKAAVQPADRR